MFRRDGARVEVLLAHPGGPFWINKDHGAWSLPKGEYQEDEDPLQAARREFAEETGFAIHEPLLPLGTVKQPGGKHLSVWAFEGDCDPGALVSNTFALEWPPHSGQMGTFPEMDRAQWFDLPEARKRIMRGQLAFLDSLEDLARDGS